LGGSRPRRFVGRSGERSERSLDAPKALPENRGWSDGAPSSELRAGSAEAMPTYTCLCCCHTETFDTPEDAFEAGWDVAPYFTLQPVRFLSVSAGPDPRARRSQTAARRPPRKLEETRTSDATPRAHREGAESAPGLTTIGRENSAASNAQCSTTFVGKVCPLRSSIRPHSTFNISERPTRQRTPTCGATPATVMGPLLRCGGGVARAPSVHRHLCSGAHRAAQNAARQRRMATPRTSSCPYTCRAPVGSGSSPRTCELR
jgi:hypothetical protein